MNKEEILDILIEWNYWDKEIPIYFQREEYENQLINLDKTDEITVIKGIRRSGKSTILINHIRNLVKKGINKKQILFVNFEDPRFLNDLNTNLLDDIIKVYRENINLNKEIYLFLDEIQNVNAWEKWVNTQYELKKIKNIYVTGSSSKLLSSEFSTALSGRYLDINVFTLSFKEYLIFNNKKIPNKIEFISNRIEYNKLFKEYLFSGGFPKIILSDEDLRKKELINYFDTIILKDIVGRYSLKNSNNIRRLALYLITNIGKIFSINSLKTSLNISYDLVENYFNYIKETYLISDLTKYDNSLKKQYLSKNKIYTLDLSFNNFLGFKFSEDFGRLLENLVFIELKRRRKEIYYYKEQNECDFIIKDGLNIISAIQVTKNLDDKKTKEREIKGLISALKEFNLKKGLILNYEHQENINIDGFEIEIKPIINWLLFD